MNILFITGSLDYTDPIKPLGHWIDIRMGISYISSVLKLNGHNTDLLVLGLKDKEKLIDKTVKEFNPKLICFTALATEYDFISKTAGYIKMKYPGIYLIAGGPHVSLNPDEVIKDPFDALCIGEGEYPVLELVEQLEKDQKPSRIKNLWIKQGREIEKNPVRDFLQDLGKLPFPDRKIWAKCIKDVKSTQPVLIGRGCPFRCTYCCNHVLAGLARGRYVRLMSPGNILKEIKDLLRLFPNSSCIYFEIETIGVNTEFALNLCSELEEFNRTVKNKLSYGANLRIIPGVDYSGLFNSLKKANFEFVNIGLESGNGRIREEILKRRYSNEDIIKAVKQARVAGLKVNLYMMVGLPTETPCDFKETIQCARECSPDEARLGIFYPYPGTELYNLCEEQGLISNNSYTGMERKKAFLDLPGFSRHKIQKEFDWFYYNIYKGRRPLLSNIIYCLKGIISRNMPPKILNMTRSLINNLRG
ncbi:MAG: radical SAM protein [Armatimonadota bacterium]